MQSHQYADANPMLDEEIPADLGRAGAVVDKAIDYMIGEDIGTLSIASALLGGALGLLARTLDDGAIVQILNKAIAGVRAGDLHSSEPIPPVQPGPRLRPPGRA
jgi:hypothetical protein